MRPGGPGSLVGTVLSGRYRIDKVIGEGGMGVVYAAEHLHMRKRMAVKILHPEMSRLPEVVERFEREAMAAAHIDHPNVAAATDFGKLDDGSFFLVLEYIEGQSLRDVIGRGRLEVPRALHIMEQIAAALGRATAIGIVHRDLKPENIMLIQKDADPDFVKVLDFGIAKVPVAELSQAPPHDPARPVLTQLGMVYGTPEYMAPEQALGQVVDSRADLYALGVMTYEMLTGVRPFDHDSKVTLLGMQVTSPVPPMSKSAPDANVPPAVEALVLRLLAKEASLRFADGRELLDEMNRALGLPEGGPASMGRRTSGISRASLPESAKPGDAAGIPPTAVAPAVTADPAPGSRGPALDKIGVLSSRLKAVPPKTWGIVGASVGAVVFFVFFVEVLAGGSAPHPTEAVPDAEVIQGDKGPAAIAKTSASATADRDLAAAKDALAQGDAPGALKLLVPLGQAFPARGDVHHAMEQAYLVEHDTKDALDEAKAWLAADPKAASDPELADLLRAAAVGRESPEAALALLEGPMGALGVDVLYDLAYGPKMQGAIAGRAKQALASLDVRGHASEAALVALDLRAATSCEARRAILVRARDAGDARAGTLLSPLTATRGCGFLGSRDCWPCLHRDGALKDAIAAIQARANVNP